MKREFSFYEFVGLLIPGVILLYALNFVLSTLFLEEFVDFTKLGESIIFLVLSYGAGHIIQSIGNYYDKFIWLVYKGMPTRWLTQKNRFKENLFSEPFNNNIIIKLQQKFGTEIADYGPITYNLLFLNSKTQRIDIFNGNYSMFRGLSITFLALTILCCSLASWILSVVFFICLILMTKKMVSFGKYYAKEVYLTFYNFYVIDETKP